MTKDKALHKLKDASRALLVAPPTTLEQVVDLLESRLEDYREAQREESKKTTQNGPDSSPV